MHALVLLLGLAAALRMPGPLSSRVASYAIDAQLDEQAREIQGEARLRWRNDGTEPVAALPFHLYMNAFQNERSRFFSPSWPFRGPAVEKGRWGYCRVTAVSVDGAVQHAGLEPEADDATVATLVLPRPVPPGGSIEVTLRFTTRLPRIIARAGEANGFYAVAQWFPKVAVQRCDPSCAFSAASYDADSEFFSDFGVYDVRLDVPAPLVVGATGILVEDRVEGPRRKLTWHAEDVHDFVWAAARDFIEHTERVDDGSGLPPVEVRLLGAPALAAHAARHLATVRAGLRELGRRLGFYPYRALTVVQVPRGAEEAGGMEYPNLFFTQDRPAPLGLHALEVVTAHELAHQWFQGMLASDEAHEPWLDEGLAELATGWVLGAQAEDGRPAVYELLGHRLGYADMERNLLGETRSDPIATASQAFRDHVAYAELSYRKPSLLFATLNAQMGAAAFDRALRSYADQHRFGHPTRRDLVRAFAGAPAPLRALLDDGLDRPGILDYAVTAVRTAPRRTPAGLFETDGGVLERQTLPIDGAYHSEITVERLGQHLAPVRLRLRFADGHLSDHNLGVLEAPPWRRVALDHESPLLSATLNPDGEVPLDVHRWNDGLRAAPDRGPRRHIADSARLIAALLLSWLAR